MNKRDALEDFVQHSVMLPEERNRIMAAADAYGDERELIGRRKEHAKVCRRKVMAPKTWSALMVKCGEQNSHCPDAPKGENDAND